MSAAAAMILTIGRRSFDVADLAEASRVYCRERDQAEFDGRGGVRAFPHGVIAGAKTPHFVSYNGRVWAGTPGNPYNDLVMEAQ